MFSKAITSGIISRPLGVDTLLMNEETSQVHCLNQVAYLVYHHSNGERSSDEISERIVSLDGVVCTPEAVDIALEQLVQNGLVEYSLPELTPERELRRREVLQKLAAMMAVPVILSMSGQSGQAQDFCFTTAVPIFGPFGSVQGANLVLTCPEDGPDLEPQPD